MNYTILIGDVRQQLRTLQAESVHCVITSPPYWGLRAYGTEPQLWNANPECSHEFEAVFTPNQNCGGGVTPKQSTNRGSYQRDGGALPTKDDGPRGKTTAFCVKCGAWKGELGSEPNPNLFVANIVEVFREVRRVLRPDGVLWVNLGDSYAGSGGAGGDYNAGGLREGQPKAGGSHGCGLPAKNLVGIPWRVALAMQADGWILRSECPWVKSSAMPSSVKDRPSVSHEWWFMFVKQQRYYYDINATRIKTGNEMTAAKYAQKTAPGESWAWGGKTAYAASHKYDGGQSHPGGRARRTADFFYESLDELIEEQESYLRHLRAAWQAGMIVDPDGEPFALNVNPEASKEKHFATFGNRLIIPLVKASSPEQVCSSCGAPWVRQVVDSPEYASIKANQNWKENRGETMITGNEYGRSKSARCSADTLTIGFAPSCECNAEPCAGTVLDPFSGTGTTGVIALRYGRRYIGIELNPEYAAVSEKRLSDEVAQVRLPFAQEPERGGAAELPALLELGEIT